tara:strand:+ start:1754 stop:2191 length:438 start_codon:yes stop_codon:yes gene_type:complete
MAKNIGIIVEDNLGNPIYGAKTYIGTKDGSFLYDRSKGQITDTNGNAILSVGTMPLIPQYVWVKEPNLNFEEKQLYRSSKQSPYKFEIPKVSQTFDEVVIVAKKPQPKDKPKVETKKAFFDLPMILISLVGVSIIGFLIYKKQKG